MKTSSKARDWRKRFQRSKNDQVVGQKNAYYNFAGRLDAEHEQQCPIPVKQQYAEHQIPTTICSTRRLTGFRAVATARLWNGKTHLFTPTSQRQNVLQQHGQEMPLIEYYIQLNVRTYERRKLHSQLLLLPHKSFLSLFVHYSFTWRGLLIPFLNFL